LPWPVIILETLNHNKWLSRIYNTRYQKHTPYDLSWKFKIPYMWFFLEYRCQKDESYRMWFEVLPKDWSQKLYWNIFLIFYEESIQLCTFCSLKTVF
jgi:hypothetical protein